MPSISKQISFMYIEYSTAFHMKFKHLFSEAIYDNDRADKYPLVITWAESYMATEDGNDKCLAISAKTAHYLDSYKVTEEFFEDALQSFFLFPDSDDDDDKDSSNLRLEFVKALLHK